MKAGRTSILRRRALFHFACYAIDMAMAITAFVVGFGLQVHNWWALILIGVVSRFVFHTSSQVLHFATAREQMAENTEEKA